MNSGQSRRARMATAREAGDLYSSPPQQEASPPERTTTAVQSRRHSMDSIHMYLHSDQLEATTETCSCGGGGVCSDDCCATADRSTSLNSIVLIKLQMQNLDTVSVCPSVLDSGYKLIKLPDDLIREVLKKLSIKETVRMGCLNTAWYFEIRRLINGEGHGFN